MTARGKRESSDRNFAYFTARINYKGVSNVASGSLYPSARSEFHRSCAQVSKKVIFTSVSSFTFDF